MGLALGMALKFYTSVAKELRLKVRKFFLFFGGEQAGGAGESGALIPIFAEVTWQKLHGKNW